MTVHILKTWPAPYEAVIAELKTFEFRKADRNFKVGDILELHEFIPGTGAYTGRFTRRVVTYLLAGGGYGLPEDYCIMAIRR